MAAKQTPNLIPLCHPLLLTQVDVAFEVDDLDAATLSTLNRSRHRALEEAGRHNPAVLRWVPVTGVAGVNLVVRLAAAWRSRASASSAPGSS